MTTTLKKRKIIVVKVSDSSFDIKLPNNAVKVTGILVTVKRGFFIGG